MVLTQWIRRGVRRLTRPDVLRRMDVAGVTAPRCTVAKENGKPLVYFAETNSEPGMNPSDAAVCEEFFRRLSGRWESMESGFCPTDVRTNARVLVKINLNTADPYPASTDPVMLRALLVFLREAGFEHIRVGDCSAVSVVPTRKVAEKNGTLDAVSGLGDFVCFDENPWLTMKTDLPLLPSVTVPQAVYETDYLIHLANLKTHSLADFSIGMKLGVGYMHPLERYELHKGNLQEKVAELASVVSPDFTLVDGRKAFVCGGPDKGRIEPANIIIAGRNPLAVDVAAYLRLYELKHRFSCVEGFLAEPFSMRQLAYAREIGVGGVPWHEYDLVEI